MMTAAVSKSESSMTNIGLMWRNKTLFSFKYKLLSTLNIFTYFRTKTGSGIYSSSVLSKE